MRACNPATRNADGPMSTPRRLAPRSMGTPMMRIFCGISYSPERRAQNASSRVHAINHAREGNHLPDVLCAANPGYGALEAQTKAGVGHAAVAAQIQIPLEGIFGKIVLTQALDQQIVIVNTLAAADDFAIAFGREHVEGER